MLPLCIYKLQGPKETTTHAQTQSEELWNKEMAAELRKVFTSTPASVELDEI